jgi:hypothetical protein
MNTRTSSKIALSMPPPPPPQDSSFRESKGRFYPGSKSQKKPTTNNRRKNPNTNSFEALNNLREVEEVENPHKVVGKDHNNNKEDQQLQGHLILGIQDDPQTFPDIGKEP